MINKDVLIIEWFGKCKQLFKVSELLNYLRFFLSWYYEIGLP
jgi:hypothetical protein